MIEIASKIVLCLIIAAFIGFLIGFLIGRATKKGKYSSISLKPSKKIGNIYDKPIIFSSPRPLGKDDLKKIEGINSSIESQLNYLGIFHFDQISNWNSKNCQWVESYLNMENKIEEEKWVIQAKELSKTK